MKAKDIKLDDIFIVSPGRSVLTAKRGMAHAGGKITIADVSAETMEGYLTSGKVTVDEEAVKALALKRAAADLAKDRAIEDGKERAAAEEAERVVAAKAKEPATEADIIEAIGKLDKNNTEHWTTSDKPQVSAIEGLLGKQISAADRDAAWTKVNEAQ